MSNFIPDPAVLAAETDTIRTLAYVLKPTAPTPYTGEIDAEECLNFMDSCEEYYSILQLAIALWVKFVVLNLTGDARSWWRTSEMTITTPWSEFRAAFIARFTPPDSVNKARESLKNLKQGRKGVATYTAEFRRFLRLIPNMDKGDALYVYLTGLEAETSKQVRLRQPTSLAAAITEATIVHSILFPDGFPQALPQARVAPAVPVDSMAMELDNIRLELNALRSAFSKRRTGTLGPLTQTERQQLIETGSCFKCRQPGHMANACPLRSSGNARSN
jgi:Retrotransposon gag protein/Zinc knuckle